MFTTKGYAAHSAHEPLKPFSFERREPTPTDVQIEILFCGVCYSDLHIVRNEWGFTTYPCVPGHEIVGHVVKTGREVKKFKEGDRVAVGCMVDSCRDVSGLRKRAGAILPGNDSDLWQRG
jgi:alcohol dehydrogenase (NADP+)